MEEFFKGYQHTFSALGAVGTLLAVIVSLYFGYKALKTQKTQIKANLGIYNITGTDKQYLAINIRNVGLIPCTIPCFFFCFKVPFCGTSFALNTLDSLGEDININIKKYPYKIEAKQSELFVLSYIDAVILKNINERLINFIRAEIYTDDGSAFKVKVSKKIKSEIKKNIKR